MSAADAGGRTTTMCPEVSATTCTGVTVPCNDPSGVPAYVAPPHVILEPEVELMPAAAGSSHVINAPPPESAVGGMIVTLAATVANGSLCNSMTRVTFNESTIAQDLI